MTLRYITVFWCGYPVLLAYIESIAIGVALDALPVVPCAQPKTLAAGKEALPAAEGDFLGGSEGMEKSEGGYLFKSI